MELRDFSESDQQLKVGDKFSSFAELEKTLQKYQDTKYVQLWKRHSRSLLNARRRAPNRKFNVNLKYDELHYHCIHGGVQYLSKSGGQRPNTKTFRRDCPAEIRLKSTADGQRLQITALNEEHNHEISKEAYNSLPHKRKLTKDEISMIENLLSSSMTLMGVRDRVEHLTGKVLMFSELIRIKANMTRASRNAIKVPVTARKAKTTVAGKNSKSETCKTSEDYKWTMEDGDHAANTEADGVEDPETCAVRKSNENSSHAESEEKTVNGEAVTGSDDGDGEGDKNTEAEQPVALRRSDRKRKPVLQNTSLDGTESPLQANKKKRGFEEDTKKTTKENGDMKKSENVKRNVAVTSKKYQSNYQPILPAKSKVSDANSSANPLTCQEYAQCLGLQPTVKFRCFKCGEASFSSVGGLNEHVRLCGSLQRSHKVFLCSACGTYFQIWDLFIHMKETHNRYICLVCLRIYNNVVRLVEHLAVSHNITGLNLKTVDDFHRVFPRSSYLTCCACLSVFTDQDNFSEHVCSVIEPKEASDDNMCKVCNANKLSCQHAKRKSWNKQNKLLPSASGKEVKGRNDEHDDYDYFDDDVSAANLCQVYIQDGEIVRKPERRLLQVEASLFQPIKPEQSVQDKCDTSQEDQTVRQNPSTPSTTRENSGNEKVEYVNVEIKQEPVDEDVETSETVPNDEMLQHDANRTEEKECLENSNRKEKDTQSQKEDIPSASGKASESTSRKSVGKRTQEKQKSSVDGSDDDGSKDDWDSEGSLHIDESTIKSDSSVASEKCEDGEISESDGPLKEDLQADKEDISTAENTVPGEVSKEHDTEDSDHDVKDSTPAHESTDTQNKEIEEKTSKEVEAEENCTDTPRSQENQEDSENEMLENSDSSSKNEEGGGTKEAVESTEEVESRKDDLAVEKGDDADEPQKMEEEPIGKDNLCEEDTDTKAADDNTEDTTMEEIDESKDEKNASSSSDMSSEDDEKSKSEEESDQEQKEQECQSPVKEKDDIPLAGEDAMMYDICLEEDIKMVKIDKLLKACITACFTSCVYCAHARRITVNIKQLVLHLLSEHRFKPIVQTESLPYDDFVVRLKLSVSSEELENGFFSYDLCDVTDPDFGKYFNKSYECFHCHFITDLHKELYIHNRKMHQKTNLLCVMCKSNFFNYSELLCHICPGINGTETQIHYRCCFCSVDSLPSAFRLMVHVRKKHHACDVCLELTGDQQKLSNHVWKHKLNHLCYRCGIAYRNKPDITKHLFWKHGTESVQCKRCLQKKWPHVYHFCIPPQSFVCEECNSTFTKAVAMKVHRRLHTGDVPYVCDECDEGYISKKLLRKHQEIHKDPTEVNTSTEQNEGEHSENLDDSEEANSDGQNDKLPNISTSSEDVSKDDTGLEDRGEETKNVRDKSDDEAEKVPASEIKETGENSGGQVKSKEDGKEVSPKNEKVSRNVIDELDLPPLNLSSDSDDSEDEDEKRNLKSRQPEEKCKEVSKGSKFPSAPEEEKTAIENVIGNEDEDGNNRTGYEEKLNGDAFDSEETKDVREKDQDEDKKAKEIQPRKQGEDTNMCDVKDKLENVEQGEDKNSKVISIEDEVRIVVEAMCDKVENMYRPEQTGKEEKADTEVESKETLKGRHEEGKDVCEVDKEREENKLRKECESENKDLVHTDKDEDEMMDIDVPDCGGGGKIDRESNVGNDTMKEMDYDDDSVLEEKSGSVKSEKVDDCDLHNATEKAKIDVHLKPESSVSGNEENKDVTEKGSTKSEVVEGVWDNFKSYAANLEKGENSVAGSSGTLTLDKETTLTLDKDASVIAEFSITIPPPDVPDLNVIFSDHDYCLPIPREPIEEVKEKVEDLVPIETPAVPTETKLEPEKLDGEESPKIDHNYCFNNVASPTKDTPSPKKKSKSPKKKKKESVTSSSGSGSDSDSDSSSCSCGTNCSCSSSSSDSSSSSSSQSDVSDSDSSSDRPQSAKKKKEKVKAKREHPVKENENVENSELAVSKLTGENGLPVEINADLENIADQPEEIQIKESDLETEESETDEDFYDDNPQGFILKAAEKKASVIPPMDINIVPQASSQPIQAQVSVQTPPVAVQPALTPVAPILPPVVQTPTLPVSSAKVGAKKRKRTLSGTKKSRINPVSYNNNFTDLKSVNDARNVVAETLLSVGDALANWNTPNFDKQNSFHQKFISPYGVPTFSVNITDAGSEASSVRGGHPPKRRRRVPKRFLGDSSDEEQEVQVKKRKDPVTKPQLKIKKPISRRVQMPPKKKQGESSNESDGWPSSSDNHSDSEEEQPPRSIIPPPAPVPVNNAPGELIRHGGQGVTKEENDNLYCYCQCPYDEVSEMIACDGKNCAIEWFHFECVGIMVPPKGKWYCPDCRKRTKSEKPAT